MDQKLLYTAPEVEPFVVRFEGVICGSPNYGNSGGAGANQGYNDYDDDF